jgi:hypothetical protein
MSVDQRVTILDVLQNALGGDLTAARADSLTERELENLAECVNEFYDSYELPESEGELRLYSGGWIAGNWEEHDTRQYLFTSLVYYPNVIIHDPVAEWFYPRRDSLQLPPGVPSRNNAMILQASEAGLLSGDGYYVFKSNPKRSRDRLAQILPLMSELAPLFQKGVILPVSQWQIVRAREQAILTAVRHDNRDAELAAAIANPVDVMPPRSDHLRGFGMTPNMGWKPGQEQRALVQDPSYFLNKTLAIADAISARYVPPAATDAALLDVKLKRLGEELKRHSIELKLAPALASAALPFLEELDPKVLLAIRSNEEAFDSWRRELRIAVRAIQAVPSSGEAFAREAREILNDALLPSAREVSRTVSTSSVLKRATKEQGINLAIGAGTALVTSPILHVPLSVGGLAVMGVSTAARWLYSTLFRGAPSGSRAVMAKLVKR